MNLSQKLTSCSVFTKQESFLVILVETDLMQEFSEKTLTGLGV